MARHSTIMDAKLTNMFSKILHFRYNYCDIKEYLHQYANTNMCKFRNSIAKKEIKTL